MKKVSFLFKNLNASLKQATRYRGSELGSWWGFWAEWNYNNGLMRKGIDPFDYSDAQE